MALEVGMPEFAAAHAAGAFVMDVREPYEYADGHVPGARLVPMAGVPGYLSELPREVPVYVICASGARSYTVAAWLQRAGIAALSVAGGTGAWVRRGGAIVRGMQAYESAA